MNEMLERIGIPYTFQAFPTKSDDYTPPEPPFITYLIGDSSNFFADGAVYEKITNIMIELYTDRYSPETEAKVEMALRGEEIAWETEREWISSENMYQTVYSFQITEEEKEDEERE